MKVLIHADSPGLDTAAKALAVRLGIPFTPDQPVKPGTLWLKLTPDAGTTGYRLQPVYNQENSRLELDLDFGSGRIQWRTRHGGMKQALARAVGLGKHQNASEPFTVLDLTGGFGRDAFALAALGAQVTMIECNPLVAAVTRNAIERALDDPATRDIAERLTLIEADSIQYLARMTETFDTLYLDPMFPPTGKNAEVKKESRLLRIMNSDQVGDTESSMALLEAACNTTVSRITLKRHKSTPVTQNPRPTGIISGKTIRYEIFTGKGRSSTCHRE